MGMRELVSLLCLSSWDFLIVAWLFLVVSGFACSNTMGSYNLKCKSLPQKPRVKGLKIHNVNVLITNEKIDWTRI